MYERLLTWMLNPAFAIFSIVASCRLPFGSPKRNFGFFFITPPNPVGSAGANHGILALFTASREYPRPLVPSSTRHDAYLDFSHKNCYDHACLTDSKFG